MDTKLKNYSHSLATKIIVFLIVIACFTGAIASFVNIVESNNGDFGIVFEENYYESRAFAMESGEIINILTRLIVEYKSEEYLLNGGTIAQDEINNEEIIHDNNFERVETTVSDDSKTSQTEQEKREYQIAQDLRQYNSYLRKLSEYKGLTYYVTDGENVLTNTDITEIEKFKAFPVYFLIDKFDEQVYPAQINRSRYHWHISNNQELVENNSTLYMAYTDEFLSPRIKDWQESKRYVTNSLYIIGGFLLGLILSFGFLVLITGRKTFKDKELQWNIVDRLYNDINLGLCITLIAFWFVLLDIPEIRDIHVIIIPITVPIASLGLVLVLSLVKHLKNRTLLKHTLIYSIINKIYAFIKDIYNSGSLAIKIALLLILYPIVAAGTFFMFPVTIGFAVWMANKKVKEFNAIVEGVERVKNGEIYHEIKVSGEGEFAKLAENINGITEGLSHAVDNELKSERLKTELITNVSHDIRTPLTSIITYVDLLKGEADKIKADEYIEIIDQKSQRLKVLTDDLFEAAKASSGSIPVNYEKIDIVSLITQGLGELNDKIEASDLKFKLNHPKDKVYVKADGKLLWRSMENLLSNIFKYALPGSRVYMDIENLGTEIVLTMKNISAHELNISSHELMERFKRGDESRTTQGSGLGLSIAKSLIEVQKGNFDIEIDGDLFKAIIRMPVDNSV